MMAVYKDPFANALCLYTLAASCYFKFSSCSSLYTHAKFMAHTDKSRQQHSSGFKGHMLHAGEQIFSTYFEEAIEESASTSSLSISAEMPIK